MENLHKKGEILIKQDNYLEAFEVYSSIIYQTPSDARALERIRFLFDRIQRGNLNFDPETAMNFLARGIAKFYNKDFVGSIEDYDKVIELDSQNHYALKCKAFSLQFLSRNEEAIKLLLLAVNLKSEGEYYDDIASNYYKLNLIENALDYNELAIDHCPHDARLIFNYGFHLMKSERYVHALIQFDQALKIRPNYEDAHKSLLYCLSKIESDIH